MSSDVFQQLTQKVPETPETFGEVWVLTGGLSTEVTTTYPGVGSPHRFPLKFLLTQTRRAPTFSVPTLGTLHVTFHDLSDPDLVLWTGNRTKMVGSKYVGL